MGSIWLNGRTPGYPSLEAVIAGAGLTLRTWDGWADRSRSSGGYTALQGIVCHHTASPTSSSFDNDWRYCAVGHPDAPVASILLGRDGTVGLHAGGAANHAGKSEGPWVGSKGTIPTSDANARTVGIEAQNNGTGELWAPIMVEAYEVLVAALCSAYALDPLRDVLAHAKAGPGWTSRKIDPWGGTTATPGFPYTGPRVWAMPQFCTNVAARIAAGPDPEEDDMPPVLMLIAPVVEGVTDAAWFVRYSSGRLVWASNAEATWCANNGIAATSVPMGPEQYARLLAEAQGWPDAPPPAAPDPEVARASAPPP